MINGPLEMFSPNSHSSVGDKIDQQKMSETVGETQHDVPTLEQKEFTQDPIMMTHPITTEQETTDNGKIRSTTVENGENNNSNASGMKKAFPWLDSLNTNGNNVVSQQQYINMMGALATVPGFNIPGMPGVQKAIQPAAPDMSIPPNETLYVNNLNDKIKIDKLKQDLTAMFSQFGTILDIIAMKSFWRRGQAWIIFEKLDDAVKAMNSLQGFEYHNKPMRINYARSRSDIFSKKDNTFVERDNKPRKPRAILQREQQLQQKFQQMMTLQQQAQQGDKSAAQALAPFIANIEALQEVPPPTVAAQGSITALEHNSMQQNWGTPTGPVRQIISVRPPVNAQMDKQAVVAAAAQAAEAAKKRKLDSSSEQANLYTSNSINRSFFSMPGVGVNLSGVGGIPPSKKLLIDGIPDNCMESDIKILFSHYPNFVELKLIPENRVAFVEYQNPIDAGAAMNGLQNFELTKGYKLRITYAH